MIAIVDYGAGNLRSVRNAFAYLGAQTVTVSSPEGLDGADQIVLPGVGAFGAGIAALRAAGFEGPIKELVGRGVPLLGICLGMQYLFESSDEMGTHRGLGLLPGRVTRFPADDERMAGLKVPHMGWNRLSIRHDSPLVAGLPDGGYAYFVHSYYVEAADPDDVIAVTRYGIDFAAVVGRANIFGIQPHPEKSQKVGLHILRSFIQMGGAR